MGVTDSYTAAELVTVMLAVVLVILLSILAYRAWQRSRITPVERERRRCAWLVVTGKISDATLVEIQDRVVFYSYAVRGVEYTASQDLSVLDRAPIDLCCIRALSVKYDPRNPANSIVLSEDWSGLVVGRTAFDGDGPTQRDRPTESDHPNQSDHTNQSDHPNQSDHTNQSDHPNQSDHTNQSRDREGATHD